MPILYFESYLPDSLLKEVCLSLEANHLHPLEGVGNIVEARAFQGNKETVGAKLNVLAHEIRVHTNQFDWKGILNKLLFNINSI